MHHDIQSMSHSDENGSDFGSLVLVHSLDTLNLLAVLEDDDGGKRLELEVLLGRRELLHVDLEGFGVGGVLASIPVGVSGRQGSSWERNVLLGPRGHFSDVGKDQDVFLRRLESGLELFLGSEFLVG